MLLLPLLLVLRALVREIHYFLEGKIEMRLDIPRARVARQDRTRRDKDRGLFCR